MMKPCPYCAEDVQSRAVRCPHCRSRLSTFAVEGWHRDQSGKMVAGVAAALSRALGVPVALVRAGFVVLSFVHLVGLFAYGLLWLMIPWRPDEPSILETVLARAQAVARSLSGRGAAAEPERHREPASSDAARIAINERGGDR